MNTKYYIDKHTEDIEPHFHIIGKCAAISLIDAKVIHGDNDLTNLDIVNIDNDMYNNSIRRNLINEWNCVNNDNTMTSLGDPIYYYLIDDIMEGPKSYNKHTINHVGRETREVIGFLSPDDLATPIFIRMYDKDHNPPHFHVVGKDGKTVACLELLNAEYYDHGYKRDTVLSDKMLEMIDNMLRREYFEKESIYESMLFTWQIYSDNNIDTKHRQPDYTKTIRHK